MLAKQGKRAKNVRENETHASLKKALESCHASN